MFFRIQANEEKTETTTTAEETPVVDVKDSSQSDIDKLRKDIELKYHLPTHRSIVVHPTTSKGDKFDCRVVSLHYLLNYANKDTIKEKSFELYLFSEAFQEMLMRDYSYDIYRTLFSCLEVTETTSTEPMITTTATTEEQPNEEENEKKRKRTESQEEEESAQKKKTNSEETNPTTTTTTTTAVQTRSKTVHPELLLSFTFFDRNRCGYLLEKDLEEILLLSGLSLTKNEVNLLFLSLTFNVHFLLFIQTKILVSRVSTNEKVQYHKLTDKDVPIDSTTTSELEIRDQEIDALAPKGNLHFLPSNLVVFGVRSKTTTDNPQILPEVDNQRAIKQLEMSNKIQTSLELKIDALKSELRMLKKRIDLFKH